MHARFQPVGFEERRAAIGGGDRNISAAHSLFRRVGNGEGNAQLVVHARTKDGGFFAFGAEDAHVFNGADLAKGGNLRACLIAGANQTDGLGIFAREIFGAYRIDRTDRIFLQNAVLQNGNQFACGG